MNYEKIEAYAEAFAAAPRLAELEIRTGSGGVLRLRRSLESAEKKSRPAKKPANKATTAIVETTPATPTPTGTVVTSTLVGVFRVATKVPIQQGDTVSANQVLGTVEAMRIPNEVIAPASGVLTSVFVQDGQPVEYGQPLFEIDGTTTSQE